MTRLLPTLFACGVLAAALSGHAAAQEAPASPPQVLRPVGSPELRTGQVARGEVFLRVPVTHGITGQLTNRVKALGLFARHRPLEPGQPVFGVPLYGGQVMWCAPRKDEKSRWSTVCLPHAGNFNRWVEIDPPMFVMSLSTGAATSGADTPQVRAEPVDFGVKMTAVYRYASARRGQAFLDVTVETEEGVARSLIPLPLPTLPGGGGLLPALGGVLKITPAADGKTASVEVVRPLGGGQDLPL